MRVIFVVSPNYLEAVLKESKKFDFDLQGYGTFARASKGVLRTNVSDYLGFAYVGDSVPTKGTKEYTDMLEFISRCNLMQANKKFVFIVPNGITASLAKKLKVFKHLRFFMSGKFDFMSDTVINKNLFGSILLDNEKPYYLGKKAVQKERVHAINNLSLLPVINDSIVHCVDDFYKYSTLQETFNNDLVRREFEESGSGLLSLREFYIAKKLNAADLDDYRNKAAKSVEQVRESEDVWCLMLSLFLIIERGEEIT